MSAYTPGPGDLMPTFAGHPHDPRTPEPDGDYATIDIIDEVREYMLMAEAAVGDGDTAKARRYLHEVRELIEDLIGAEQ